MNTVLLAYLLFMYICTVIGVLQLKLRNSHLLRCSIQQNSFWRFAIIDKKMLFSEKFECCSFCRIVLQLQAGYTIITYTFVTAEEERVFVCLLD